MTCQDRHGKPYRSLYSVCSPSVPHANRFCKIANSCYREDDIFLHNAHPIYSSQRLWGKISCRINIFIQYCGKRSLFVFCTGNFKHLPMCKTVDPVDKSRHRPCSNFCNQIHLCKIRYDMLWVPNLKLYFCGLLYWYHRMSLALYLLSLSLYRILLSGKDLLPSMWV